MNNKRSFGFWAMVIVVIAAALNAGTGCAATTGRPGMPMNNGEFKPQEADLCGASCTRI